MHELLSLQFSSRQNGEHPSQLTGALSQVSGYSTMPLPQLGPAFKHMDGVWNEVQVARGRSVGAGLTYVPAVISMIPPSAAPRLSDSTRPLIEMPVPAVIVMLPAELVPETSTRQKFAFEAYDNTL